MLSVAIPTYNRANYLDSSLKLHIPIFARHKIPILIRDNGSNDDTEEIINKWIKVYPHISYRRNTSNLGPDKNFELALSDASTKYVWLLGDTYTISNELIEFVLDQGRSENPDFFVFNHGDRVKGVPSKTYHNCNHVLTEIGWHMTCMATLVYKTEILSKLRFKRFLGCNFVQLGIILEYIAEENCNLIWKSELSVKSLVIGNEKKISEWHFKAINVWVCNWINFVTSLPYKYSYAEKIRCIKDHGIKSGIFTISGLIKLRARRAYTFTELVNNFRMMGLAMSVFLPLRILIIFIPPRFLQWLEVLLNQYRKSRRIF